MAIKVPEASGQTIAIASLVVAAVAAVAAVLVVPEFRCWMGLDACPAGKTPEAAQSPVPQPQRTCRDPSHGIERYGREFDVSRDSGWRGGGSGYSQNDWCNELIGQLRGENPGALFSVGGSSENQKTTCAPLNCPQYLYHCTVHVKADPIYVEKASPACK
jgi:hypothetical protein